MKRKVLAVMLSAVMAIGLGHVETAEKIRRKKQRIHRQETGKKLLYGMQAGDRTLRKKQHRRLLTNLKRNTRTSRWNIFIFQRIIIPN